MKCPIDFRRFWVGDLVGGVVGGISSLFNSGKQYRNQKKLMAQQHQYNLETMEKQNQYNVENWEMNNAYNDPAAVVSRYEAAGMDVNQAFGGSSHYTPSQQVSGSAPVGTGAPTAPMSKYLDPQSAVDTALALAQIRNIDADTKQKEGDTKDPEVTKRMQSLQVAGQELDNVLKDKKGESLDLANGFQASLNRVQNAVEGFQVAQAEQELFRTQQEVLNAVKQGKLTDAEVDKVIAQMELVNEQIITEGIEQQLKSSQKHLTDEQARQVAADIRKTASEIGLLDAKAANERLMKLGIRSENERKKLIVEAQRLANEEQKIRNENLPKDLRVERNLKRTQQFTNVMTGIAKGVATATGGAALAGLGGPGGNQSYTDVTTESYEDSRGNVSTRNTSHSRTY